MTKDGYPKGQRLKVVKARISEEEFQKLKKMNVNISKIIRDTLLAMIYKIEPQAEEASTFKLDPALEHKVTQKIIKDKPHDDPDSHPPERTEPDPAASSNKLDKKFDCRGRRAQDNYCNNVQHRSGLSQPCNHPEECADRIPP